MRHHPLGRTGLFVSELCLGTMTFGGSEGMWGVIGKLQQSDAERLDRPVARRRHQLHRHRRRLRRRRVGTDHRPGAEEPEGPARERRRRDQGVRRDRHRRQHARRQPRPHHGRRQGQPEAAATRSHRPVPDPRLRPRHADRGDGARARPAGAPRPCALRRRVQLGGLADRQGAGHRRAARPGALRIAAGLLHRRRPRPRARADPDAAQRRRGPDGVESAGRRPAERQVRPRAAGRSRQPARWPSISRR